MILKHHRFAGLALALVVAALLAPAASARPIDRVTPQTQPAQPAQASAGPYESALPGLGAGSRQLYSGAQPPQRGDPPAKTVRIVQPASNPGFDWGDAGIGAGAAIALAMIGVGAVLLVGNRRQREARPTTAA